MPRYLILLLTILLAACAPGDGYRDAEIDADMKAKPEALNNQLVAAIRARDVAAITALCNDEDRKNNQTGRNIRMLIDFIFSTGQPGPWTTKHLFYNSRGHKQSAQSLRFAEGSEHEYAFNYNVPIRKYFISIGYFEDSIQAKLLFTMWGSYNGDWKLCSANAGVVKVFGRDAVDWYYHARQQYGDHALADAAVSMSVCRQLLEPLKSWRYTLDDDMRALVLQIRNTADLRYKFPLTPNGAADGLKVFRVGPELVQEGLFPVVSYATALRHADTAALSRECDSLNAHIGEIFEGLDHYNHKIVYRAYARMPADSNDRVPYYVFMKRSASSWFY